VHFVGIWYIFAILVYCVKKNGNPDLVLFLSGKNTRYENCPNIIVRLSIPLFSQSNNTMIYIIEPVAFVFIMLKLYLYICNYKLFYVSLEETISRFVVPVK
jgi:hypothetical protein